MSTIEIYRWEQEGYKPLVFSDSWQVALLNWEPLFNRENLDEIERHNETDEVFVLLSGWSVLFARPESGTLEAIDMEPGIIYNVPKGVWHNLVASRDVAFLIVENKNTHLDDTEIRPIEAGELELLDEYLQKLGRVG
jgi:mannose-6-phosphate isomerase-like protein (cupin superfamily)